MKTYDLKRVGPNYEYAAREPNINITAMILIIAAILSIVGAIASLYASVVVFGWTATLVWSAAVFAFEAALIIRGAKHVTP